MKKEKNIYLLAGGNWRKPDLLIPLFREILTETGKEKPRIAYIGTANEDDPSFFTFADSLLKKAGAETVTQIFLAENDINLPLAKSALSKADAVFVAGGDVDEGMRWLNLHKLAPFLKKLYQNGILFFGLSAGSIMLGTHWVRWENPEDDSSAELFGCIGITPIICDTHAEKDDWEELKAAVKLLDKDGIGYGIPTGGVLRVAPDGKLTALKKNTACYAKQSNRVIKEADISADNK